MRNAAIAMVKWEVFRPTGGGGGAAVFDYGSDQKQLHVRAAEGGTLWLITSTRRGKDPRRYHLAYKLVDCTAIPREESIFSGQWKYVVRARNWTDSRHFGFNDATDTIRRLRFTAGKPMSAVSNLGLRLMTIPQLSAEDVVLLERLQHKLEEGRTVFISYSHEDVRFATEIEIELGKRDVSVSRDVAFLKPGQQWKEALRREVAATDCFVVLISPKSAESEWVRREVGWAIGEYEAGGLVKAVVPIVLRQGGWERFEELHHIQRWDYPESTHRTEMFDRLAQGIARGGR